MFKTLTLLKRKPGLSMEAFIERYETIHARIGERYLAAGAVRYVRRYLHPLPDEPSAADKPYDVAMEIWFEDRAAFERVFASLRLPGPAAEIAADEERMFDRAHNRLFLLEEHESDLAAALAAQQGTAS